MGTKLRLDTKRLGYEFWKPLIAYHTGILSENEEGGISGLVIWVELTV